jgi:hypothetical protein
MPVLSQNPNEKVSMKNTMRSFFAVLAGLALAATVAAAPIGGGSGDVSMSASNVSVQHEQTLAQPVQAQAAIAPDVAIRSVAVGHQSAAVPRVAHTDIQPYGLGRHTKHAALPRAPDRSPYSG